MPCRRCKRLGFDLWIRKIPWSRKWQPTPVILTGKFHKQRSWGGCSPWGHKELDVTEHTQRTWSIYSVVLVSCVQESESVTHTRTYICVYILFQVFSHYRLLQDIEYRSSCYIQSLFGDNKLVFYVCKSISVL